MMLKREVPRRTQREQRERVHNILDSCYATLITLLAVAPIMCILIATWNEKHVPVRHTLIHWIDCNNTAENSTDYVVCNNSYNLAKLRSR